MKIICPTIRIRNASKPSSQMALKYFLLTSLDLKIQQFKNYLCITPRLEIVGIRTIFNESNWVHGIQLMAANNRCNSFHVFVFNFYLVVFDQIVS